MYMYVQTLQELYVLGGRYMYHMNTMTRVQPGEKNQKTHIVQWLVIFIW